MKDELSSMMKHAEALLQTSMNKAHAEIAAIEATGESGAGLVKVTITGKHDVTKVTIDPSLLNDDKEMLEDLIAAAVNDANRRIDRLAKEKIASATNLFPPDIQF